MPSLEETLLTEHQQMVSERANFDSLNQEIAELVMPDYAFFTSRDRVQGEKRTQKQYDATALTESARHASAIDSLATPHSTKWHTLTSQDQRLNERDDVQQYYDDVLDVLYAERYATHADFAAQVFDVWRAGGVFGTSALYVGDRLGGGLQYRAMPSTEVFIKVDYWGKVCGLHRRFKLTAKAALEEYGDACPQSIKDAVAKNEPLRSFWFLHVIKGNPDAKPGYIDQRGMPWVSYELETGDKKMLRQGGYSSWPVPTYRYDVSPGEWYGRGWAAQVLPEIKMLNRLRKAMIRQTEKAVDPPLLLHDDGMLTYGSTGAGQTPSLAAGSLNRGAVTADGKPLIHPLFTGADLANGDKMMAESVRVIKDAALTSLFQILVDNPQMTATEYLGRKQEKGQLIGPMIGRSLATFLGGVVERELEVLGRQGKLPQPPQVLIDAAIVAQRTGGQFGAAYKVEFNSPLSRLMKLEDVTTSRAWVSEVIQLAAGTGKMDLLDNVDFDDYIRRAARLTGVPAKTLVDRTVVDATRAQRGKGQALQQGLALAQQGADVADTVASAQQKTAATKASQGGSGDAQVGAAVKQLRNALRGGR